MTTLDKCVIRSSIYLIPPSPISKWLYHNHHHFIVILSSHRPRDVYRYHHTIADAYFWRRSLMMFKINPWWHLHASILSFSPHETLGFDGVSSLIHRQGRGRAAPNSNDRNSVADLKKSHRNYKVVLRSTWPCGDIPMDNKIEGFIKLPSWCSACFVAMWGRLWGRSRGSS